MRAQCLDLPGACAPNARILIQATTPVIGTKHSAGPVLRSTRSLKSTWSNSAVLINPFHTSCRRWRGALQCYSAQLHIHGAGTQAHLCTHVRVHTAGPTGLAGPRRTLHAMELAPVKLRAGAAGWMPLDWGGTLALCKSP